MVPRSLKGKLFVAMVLLAVIPFSLSVSVEIYLTYRNLQRQAEDRLGTQPLPALRRMENLLDARWGDVHLLSHIPLFWKPQEAEYQAAILQRATQIYEPYALVALADERGHVVAASDPKFVNADVREKRWFQEARKISYREWHTAARSIYISNPYVPAWGDGKPVMCFNSPVYDFRQYFKGVLHSEVKLRVLTPFLVSLRLGDTGRALLVAEDGKVVLDDRDALPPFKVSVARHRAFEQARAGGTATAIRDRDIEGDRALVSAFQLKGFSQHPGVRLFVLVSQKEREIYAPIRDMLLFYTLAGSLGVGLIFLGGFILFDRNISMPLARLMGAVRSLTERGPTLEGEAVTRSKDEIGELARAFSSMVRTLATKEKNQKELQEQLVQKERLAAIGEMVAGVAHQIKTPLATIKVDAQTLKEELPADASSHTALTRIDKEVNRLSQLLRAFFDFAAPREPQRSRCEVQALIQEALSHVEEERRQAGVQVSERYAEGLPPLIVDPQQMLQVFVNLFQNALQAMPEGGILSVTAKTYTPEREEPVPSDPRVSVCVSDTGCGIAAENLPKIFQAFFTTRPSGTGLGLALVYKVVQKHGGEVRVNSQPGRGSTFELLLPVTEKGSNGEG